jgi:glucan biosynthesis protein
VILTPDETNDNIVAYWVPQRHFVRVWHEFGYGCPGRGAPNVGPDRMGRADAERLRLRCAGREVVKLMVDFDGPALRKLSPGRVTADLAVNGGQRLALNVHRTMYRRLAHGRRSRTEDNR